MEKRKLPRCEDANAPQRDQETLWEDQGRWASRGRRGPGPRSAGGDQAPRVVLGAGMSAEGGGGGARSLRDKPALGGIRRGEALPLQRERH